MTGSPTARLVLSSSDPVIRARLRYALSAYAALHGIRVLGGPGAEVTVLHGPAAAHPDSCAGLVTLAAGYRPRPPVTPAPAPVWTDGLPSFHHGPGGEPDLLGEVFEWLAAPHEAACRKPDDVGRVPPEHALAGSHGLDHLAVSHLRNGMRVLKNAGIATVQERDPRPGVRILGAAARRLGRHRPTAVGVADLLAGEAGRGVRASYPVVAESTHRRDPGYRGTAVLWHDYAMTGTTLPARLAGTYWAVPDAGDRWLPAAEVAAAARARWAAAGVDAIAHGAREAG